MLYLLGVNGDGLAFWRQLGAQSRGGLHLLSIDLEAPSISRPDRRRIRC